MTLSADSRPVAAPAALLNPSLRELAPKLVTYQCELQMLIASIENDQNCSQTLIRYANKRQNDPDNQLETVHHAVVYLGLIDTKQFLFCFLLLDLSPSQRAKRVQLLIRAKLTADLFRTTGPLNKDLAFVGALLTGKTLLRFAKPETVFMLFKMSRDSKEAVRNFDFGLRDTIRQAQIIVTKCDPNSPKRAPMPAEFETLYQDALYWANTLLWTLDR